MPSPLMGEGWEGVIAPANDGGRNTKRRLHPYPGPPPSRGRERAHVGARDAPQGKDAAMKRKVRPQPRFRDEADERLFWETHDSSDYVDWGKAEQCPGKSISSPRRDK